MSNMGESSASSTGPTSSCSHVNPALIGLPWGDEVDKFEPEYDAQDDFAKSLEEGYRAIRERVAAGGRPWVPK
jgi:hypothetical protein